MVRSGGAGDVRVAGEGVFDEHHVVAGGGQFAPPLYGDRDVRQRLAALEREIADVDGVEASVRRGQFDATPLGARRQEMTASRLAVGWQRRLRMSVIVSFRR